MALTKNCNVCRKDLSEAEIEASKKENLPALCEAHLTELKTKLVKWIPLFQKMNFS